MSESESDKKRNKLGYQRISVACAHCRRRKIRCVMAENDDQNRCQNCIRLNKECVFYPVDQQQNTLDKSAASSSTRTTTTPSSATTVSQSPQDMAAGRPFEPQMQYGMMPSNTPHGFPVYDNAAMMQQQSAYNYNYRTPELGHHWSSADELGSQSQGNVAGTIHNAADTVWHGYMPLEHAHSSAHQYFPEARSYSYPGLDEARQWQMLQQQGRTMSYGGLDSNTAQLPQSSLPSQTHQFGPPITGVQSAPAIASAPFRYDQQPVFAYPHTTQSPTEQNQAGWYQDLGEHGQHYVPGSRP